MIELLPQTEVSSKIPWDVNRQINSQINCQDRSLDGLMLFISTYVCLSSTQEFVFVILWSLSHSGNNKDH